MVGAVALFALTPTSVPAQSSKTDSPPSAAQNLTLVKQTDWVNKEQAFELDLKVTDVPNIDTTDLVVTVFSAIPNRSSFNNSLEGKTTGLQSVILERRPLKELLSPEGIAHVTLPVNDPNQTRYFLHNPGVYPVRVELRDAEAQVIDQLTTHLISVDDSAKTKLNATVILPVQSPFDKPEEDPSKVGDKGLGVELIGQTLTANPDLPTALYVQPETIDRLTSDESDEATEALEVFTQAAKNRTVFGTTWAPVPSQIFETEEKREHDAQFDAGSAALKKLGAPIDDQTWISTEVLDNNALTQLRNKGIKRLVVPEGNLSNITLGTTLARPFVVSTGRAKNATLPAMQADRGIAAHFDKTEDPVLAAHNLLADLAVIWNDRPAQQRAVVIMPSRSWTPSTGFLDVLYGGLKGNPLVGPATLDQAFAISPEGSPKSPLTRQMTSLPKGSSSAHNWNQIKEDRQRLSGFESMVLEDNEVKLDLQRRHLYSESSIFDQHTRNQVLNGFKSLLDKQFNAIHVPEERSLRLTAREGEIPISIQNDTGYPIRLVLKLSSDKIQFTNGDTRVVAIDRQSATERFSIDTRASGVFPVQVRAETPDGSVDLVRSHVSVRSTTPSGLGVALTVGAGAFLVVWWSRSRWKSRKNASVTSKPETTQ